MCTGASYTQFVVPCAMDVFSAFGTILFCFGGMAVFPSIQVDMKNPKKFTKVVIISIASIVGMMFPARVPKLLFLFYVVAALWLPQVFLPLNFRFFNTNFCIFNTNVFSQTCECFNAKFCLFINSCCVKKFVLEISC